MTGCIYMLVSPTGKAYIGRTKNFKTRMRGYREKSNSTRSPIYREVAKYGFKNFQKHILEEVSADTYDELSEKLNEAERKYIEQYDTVRYGLNRNRFDTNAHVVKVSDETKEKLRKAHTGRKHSKEAIAMQSGANAYQSKKVYSDKLGMTFCSLREAAHYVGITNGCKVSECISGKRKSCGIDPKTGNRIDDWQYV